LCGSQTHVRDGSSLSESELQGVDLGRGGEILKKTARVKQYRIMSVTNAIV